MVIDNDVTANAEIKGKGKLIVKEIEKEVKVIINEQIISDETSLASHNIIKQNNSNFSLNEKVMYADNKNISIESTPIEATIKAISILDKQVQKEGSLELIRINVQYKENDLPDLLLINNVYNVTLIIQDNYLIPNNNYLLFTKELIMSSQNMHDTLFIKDILDPPKA